MGMKSPAVGVKDLLVTAAVGFFPPGTDAAKWYIAIGRLAETPDQGIACVDTGGVSPYPSLALNFPSVQVMVRGKAGQYVQAHDRGRDVIDALLGAGYQVVNGDKWEGINQIGDLAFIGYDDKNRPLFSANFSINVEPASTGHRAAIT